MKLRSLLLILSILTLTACPQLPPHDTHQTTVIAQDLLGPVGLALLPDGSLLIAEEGNGSRDTSAGITLVTPDGKSGRIISGLFSTRDAGDLAGVPLVSVSPDESTLYAANFGADHLWALPISSFSDAAGNARIPATPFQPDELGQIMPPLNNVRLTNAFAMTYDVEGNPIVSDASQNGIASTNADGTTRFFHRFEPISVPADAEQTIDAVPTGIARVRSASGTDEYLVTLFGGCPYPANSGQLVAIDTQRNQRTILDGLNLPIDIERGPDGTLWLLEFAHFTSGASCFDGSGYQPNSGRLSTVAADGTRQTVIDNLNFPGAVLPAPDGSIYISEVLSGRVVRYVFNEDNAVAYPCEGWHCELLTNVDNPLLILPKLASLGSLGEDSNNIADHKLVAQNFKQSTQNDSLILENDISPQFVNVAAESGLTFEHGAFQQGVSTDHVAGMGAGLCWIDYDNDGWLDLYVINSHSLDEIDQWTDAGGLPRNALFRNASGQFKNVSHSTRADLALRGNGCVAADFNLDGWTDLFVTAYGPNALLWNNGDGTFTEAAETSGVSGTSAASQPEWNSAASVGDLDGDGWPDLFVAGYIDLSRTIPKPTGHFPQDYYGIADRLYINLGTATAGGRPTFREITIEVGLTRAERGLGARLTDLDRDGDLDLYIANDGQPNRLYANEPLPDDPLGIGFRFIDLTESADVGDSGSGMGVAGGDYDLDGELDLFVTNWDTELNALYRNLIAETSEETVAKDKQGERSALTFQYSTYRIGLAGLGNNLTGWGAHLFDADHDTDLDILTVNGHVPVSDFAADAELVRYYQNRTKTADKINESAGIFFDWTRPAGLKVVGPLMARGSAAADYDNDGDLDIVINTIGGPPVLLQNNLDEGNWLVIDPGGVVPGLRMTATLPDGTRLVREVVSGSSYLASEDPRVHFGLGRAGFVSQFEIRWPSGKVELFEDIGGNQHLKLE